MQTGKHLPVICINFAKFRETFRDSIVKPVIFSCPIDGLNYERAWEVAEKTELEVLLKLKSTISPKHSQSELDHALQYFGKYIYDFPGEFFLQMPFLFTVSKCWKRIVIIFDSINRIEIISIFRIYWSWSSPKWRISTIHKRWHVAWNWPKTYHDALQYDEMQACIHLQMR